MPQPESGLSKSEVEETVKAALADIPQSQPGLTSAETERIARGVVASIPPKSSPAEYTKFFVDNAISRYETQASTPLSPTTTARRASTANGTCS